MSRLQCNGILSNHFLPTSPLLLTQGMILDSDSLPHLLAQELPIAVGSLERVRTRIGDQS
eukprot:11025829-Karenia_brevis.AAC.1